MTLLQPSRPLCDQGSSAASALLGGQRYPKGLHLPRWKRACGVMAELLLGQMYQAPHTSVDPWRQKKKDHWSRGRSISMQPSLCLPQRMQLLSSYQMTRRLASLLVGLKPSLHQKLSWLGVRSDPRRTRVHTHLLLQRSVPQKKRGRVRLLMKQLSREDILPKRYEVFTSNYNWVQSVRDSLLGLEAGTSPCRRDNDNSSCFVPQMVASESDLPEVITEHWLPILRREGLLMECPPDQFIPWQIGSLCTPARVYRSTFLLCYQLFRTWAHRT